MAKISTSQCWVSVPSINDSAGGEAQPTAAHRASVNQDRISWVDYAKGICIIWVVALYSTNFVQETAHATGWMQYVAEFAKPFRMPDFFMLSGLFVGRVLKRSWRTYLDTKVFHFLYFYALWATLKFVNMHAGDFMHMPASALLLEYLRWYLEPPTGPLWFIYILALFFLAVRLTQRLSPMLVFVLAAGLEIANLGGGEKVFAKFADYFVFFYFGYLFSRQIFRSADWAYDHRRGALAFLGIWLCIHSLLVVTGWSELPGIRLTLGIAGALAIMIIATILTRVSSVQWLKYAGQNSIVVYLGFVIPLGLMRRFIAKPVFITDIGTLSLVASILAAGGAMALYFLLRGTPLRFLYVRPAWLHLSKAGESDPKLEMPVKPVAE